MKHQTIRKRGFVMFLGFIISVLSGVLMSVQGVFNSQVTKQAGLWTTAAFVQLSAFVVCVIAWLITGKDGTVGQLFSVDRKYMLIGGAMGAFITITVVKSLERLGPAKSAMMIVVAQLLCSYLIELFGLFGIEKTEFDWKKAIGMILAILGIIIFKW